MYPGPGSIRLLRSPFLYIKYYLTKGKEYFTIFFPGYFTHLNPSFLYTYRNLVQACLNQHCRPVLTGPQGLIKTPPLFFSPPSRQGSYLV